MFLTGLITLLRKKYLYDTLITSLTVSQRWAQHPAAVTLCLISSINLLCGEKVRLSSNIATIIKQEAWKRQMQNAFSTAGISGKGPAGGETSDAPASTGGAFGRISDVIPPLPTPHSTTDDDDWEA